MDLKEKYDRYIHFVLLYKKEGYDWIKGFIRYNSKDKTIVPQFIDDITFLKGSYDAELSPVIDNMIIDLQNEFNRLKR